MWPVAPERDFCRCCLTNLDPFVEYYILLFMLLIKFLNMMCFIYYYVCCFIKAKNCKTCVCHCQFLLLSFVWKDSDLTNGLTELKLHMTWKYEVYKGSKRLSKSVITFFHPGHLCVKIPKCTK